MVRSMTGYGTGSFQSEVRTVAVEVRTVNHRFLDLHLRIPREYNFLESEIHHLVRSRLARGRVDISISVEGGRSEDFQIDFAAVRGYLNAAKKLKDEFHLDETLDLRTLFGLPGVLKGRDGTDGRDEGTGALVMQSLKEALEDVIGMRILEGQALQAELARHLDGIKEKSRSVRSLAAGVPIEYKQRLEERLAHLLPQSGLDPNRLAQEAALLAERADISEELSRLESHVDQFAAWLDSGEEVGKRMDFLLQEMQREVNTILSKTGNLEITQSGIAIKADIEKLREQVQNIE